MPATLNIRDLENLSGVKAHTLRIWEKRYGLLSPERTSTNIRTYSNEDLKKLLSVVAILESGKRISEVCSMSEDKITEQITKIQASEKSHDQIVVNEFIYATLACNVEAFEDLFESVLASKGLESLMENYMYPLLSRVGMLWTANKLNPAQEHFASQFIRRKLFGAIDKLPRNRKTEKFFALFLPPNEHHEIALLYAHYLISKAGHKVLYLGSNLPHASLKHCIVNTEITDVFTVLTLSKSDKERKEQLLKIVDCLEGQKLLVASPSCNEELIDDERISFLTKSDNLFKHL